MKCKIQILFISTNVKLTYLGENKKGKKRDWGLITKYRFVGQWRLIGKLKKQIKYLTMKQQISPFPKGRKGRKKKS